MSVWSLKILFQISELFLIDLLREIVWNDWYNNVEFYLFIFFWEIFSLQAGFMYSIWLGNILNSYVISSPIEEFLACDHLFIE